MVQQSHGFSSPLVFARKLCTEFVDPGDIQSHTASGLIPLVKNPDVCPVGVGEGLSRIVGKAVTMSLKPELIEATGDILCDLEEVKH